MSGLEELRRLEQGATPGPWVHESRSTGIRGGGTYDFIVSPADGIIAERSPSGTPADADFIVAARNTVPRLLAALDAVTALADGWERLGGPGSEFERAYGLQKVSVTHAVDCIRAAITDAMEGQA